VPGRGRSSCSGERPFECIADVVVAERREDHGAADMSCVERGRPGCEVGVKAYLHDVQRQSWTIELLLARTASHQVMAPAVRAGDWNLGVVGDASDAGNGVARSTRVTKIHRTNFGGTGSRKLDAACITHFAGGQARGGR
jgi:hypothetical protein